MLNKGIYEIFFNACKIYRRFLTYDDLRYNFSRIRYVVRQQQQQQQNLKRKLPIELELNERCLEGNSENVCSFIQRSEWCVYACY